MNYKKLIIIDLPDNISDKDLQILSFMVKMAVEKREYTGYKEIEEAGIDLELFLEKTNTKVNKRGCIKIDMQLVRHFIVRSFLSVSRYYLDSDIFKYEYDIFGAFKRRDPVWFIPYEEYNAYDEELLKELPEVLQSWFLRILKKGTLTPAQELLDRTYQKYVVRGEPLPDNSFYATKNKKDDLTTSVSDTSEEGSSTAHTNGK